MLKMKKIMYVDVTRLHEKTYGYVMRTGKRGNYKYWYRESITGKLYEGRKPATLLIDQYPKQQEDPPKAEIIENPWANYTSTNLQLIHTKEKDLPYNKLGITSREELELYESYLLSVAYKRVFENLKTFPEYYLPVNEERIKMLHRKIFGDLYDWAGEYRNINVSKEGFPFPPADHVLSEMKRLDKSLFNKISYQQDVDLKELAELLSYISSELTIIHPFREGNGRVVRVVTDIVTIAFNVHPPNWGVLNKQEDKETYLKCMYAGYKQNYEPLADFIYDLLLSSNS
jgi:cell filamentation protein